MTETTATSGTSTGSVEAGHADDSVPAGAPHQSETHQPESHHSTTQQPAEPAAETTAAEAGRSGQAEQPPDSTGPATAPATEPEPASPPDPTEPATRPTYTRPPGMQPPPDSIDAATERTDRWATGLQPPAAMGVPSSPALSGPPRPDGATTSASGSFPVVSASAPVSSPPRATGRATTDGVTMRPIGPAATGTGTDTGAAVGAARVGEPTRSPRNTATTPRGPRRARLGVKRVDPWSVMKFSFAVSLVLFIVVIVAASVLYLALDSMGVFTSINETIAELVESGGGEGETFRITAQGVIGTAGVLGALNVLLFTSLATLGAFIYNVCADLVGGVEVTLAERE